MIILFKGPFQTHQCVREYSLESYGLLVPVCGQNDNLFKSLPLECFREPATALVQKGSPLIDLWSNRGLVLQPLPHCKETISKFNVYNALKNYVVPTSNSNYDRKQILICCLLCGHTSGGVEQHGPQKQHIMLLVPFGSDLQSSFVFFCLPTQKNPFKLEFNQKFV